MGADLWSLDRKKRVLDPKSYITFIVLRRIDLGQMWLCPPDAMWSPRSVAKRRYAYQKPHGLKDQL